MYVRPIELANVCAVFPSQKAGRLPSEHLTKLVQYSRLMDCEVPTSDIIKESLEAGMLSYKSGFYYLTSKGKKITKTHTKPTHRLSDQTAEAFVKNILLQESSNNWCCREFILELNVDTVVKSFVFYRNNGVLKNETRWLMVLSSVGYIDVDLEKAIVQHKYLGITNELLLTIRNPLHIEIKQCEDEKNAVGDCAEYLALQYEADRLSDAGYPSLVPLIQQISSIDRSAGFDIISFKGTDPKPDTNIYIEVKGTTKDQFSFYWSQNEISIAKDKVDDYFIYGFTEVDWETKEGLGPIIIQDPISNLEKRGYSIQALDCYVTSK
jgi:hypothetical protein